MNRFHAIGQLVVASRRIQRYIGCIVSGHVGKRPGICFQAQRAQWRDIL